MIRVSYWPQEKKQTQFKQQKKKGKQFITFRRTKSQQLNKHQNNLFQTEEKQMFTSALNIPDWTHTHTHTHTNCPAVMLQKHDQHQHKLLSVTVKLLQREIWVQLDETHSLSFSVGQVRKIKKQIFHLGSFSTSAFVKGSTKGTLLKRQHGGVITVNNPTGCDFMDKNACKWLYTWSVHLRVPLRLSVNVTHEADTVLGGEIPGKRQKGSRPEDSELIKKETERWSV